jgi:hypothetical protein
MRYEIYLILMDSAKLTISEGSHNGTLTHSELIDRGGGPAKVGSTLEPAVDGNTVKGWKRNDSIPGPYWQSFADARIATLDELAKAAEEKRRAAVPDTGSKAA